MEALRVETSRVDGTLLLRMIGEFDRSGSDRFREAIDQAFDEAPPQITIDLRLLTFLDSSGMHAMFMAHKRAKEEGAHLTFVKGPEQVHRVFTITGMDDELEFQTWDSAEGTS